MDWNYLVTFVLGGAVGLGSSFLGIGGGVFIIATLPFIEVTNPREIAATSLLAIVGVVTYNTWRFRQRRALQWPVILRMGLASGLVAYIVGSLTQYLSAERMNHVVSLLLVGLAFKVLLFDSGWLRQKKKDSNSLDPSTRRARWVAMFIGSFAGAISALTGLGSGVVLSPALMTTGLVDSKDVVPTANGTMMFTTGLASLAYLGESLKPAWPQWGAIRVDFALCILAGALVSSQWGHRYQAKISPQLRRILLGSLLLGLALRPFF